MPSNRNKQPKKQKRPRKKVALFCVEGRSEITALETILAEACSECDENLEVRFCLLQDDDMTGGDITSKHGVHPHNIAEMVDKLFVRPFCKTSGIFAKDLAFMVQIIDTDGTFIDASSVKFSRRGLEKPFYKDDCIETNNPEGIRTRNKEKSENVRTLCKMSTIKAGSKTIPYRTFFFSANLDHFLHNDANLPSQNKVSLASNFACKYEEDLPKFRALFEEDKEYSDATYIESWELIQIGNASLCRHSNLGLFFNELDRKFWEDSADSSE